jgi:hypothetical protein
MHRSSTIAAAITASQKVQKRELKEIILARLEAAI